MAVFTAKGKAPIQVKTQRKRFVYRSFAADYEGKSGDDVAQGTRMENCDCTGGKLRLMNTLEACISPSTGFSIKLPSSPAPTQLFQLKKMINGTERIVYCYMVENGDLYVAAVTGGGQGKLYNVGENSKGILVYDAEKAQALAFVGKAGVFIYNIQSGQWCTTKSFLPLGCFVNGRLFTATTDGKLAYFSPFTVTSYQETMEGAGEVALPETVGKIVDIVDVNEYVYVFCEYGIFRLKAAASARDFCLETVPYNGEKIIGGSACATTHNGGEIFFMNTHGLHTLNGKKAVCHGKVAKEMIKPEQSGCKGMQVDEKYLLYFENIYSEKVAYAIDLETKQAYPISRYENATACLGGVFVEKNNYLYRLRIHDGTSSPNSLTFETPLYFGSSKTKLLKSVQVFGTGSTNLYITSEYGACERTVEAAGKSVNVHLKGDCFTFRFSCYRNSCITGFAADVVTLE